MLPSFTPLVADTERVRMWQDHALERGVVVLSVSEIPKVITLLTRQGVHGQMK